jgi:hypothetical protein
MKDHEIMEHLRDVNSTKIQVMEEMINTLQDRIRKLQEFDPIDEFYLGNSEFPDYPGNEWMKEETKDDNS